MTDERAAPRSELPPHLGPLIDEIDSAGQDAARTVAALVGKLDVPTRVRRAATRRWGPAVGGEWQVVTGAWPVVVVAAVLVLLVLGRLLRRPEPRKAG
ncbi:MAG TPA: hypothetical protein VFX16_04350 [Pseudonocardiaceae bacterium]|nr:hypothetical protein [Pseudonocardiaceae bacterium]